MSESEKFDLFYKELGIDQSNLSEETKTKLKNTLAYKLHDLGLAMQELKTAIKNRIIELLPKN